MTNSQAPFQPSEQLPYQQMTPIPAEHIGPHSANRNGNVLQWVAVVLSVVALLLSIVANLRVSVDSSMASKSQVSATADSSQTTRKADAGKQTGIKTVEFTAKEGSQLEGDYDYDDTHVKLIKLEVVGTKATLTSEVSNNGTDSSYGGPFSVTAFQNGQETGRGYISIDGKIQAGYTATVTTQFDIKDASQPVSLEIGLYSQTLQVEFDPQQ